MIARTVSIEWDATFEVGDPAIDNDHKIIFNMVNNYIEYVNRGSNKDIARNMVDAAHAYASAHFDREEDIMKAANFPNTKVHRECHTSFLLLLTDIQKRVIAGDDVSQEVAYFLITWIRTHVMKMDFEFAEFIKSAQPSH